MFSATNNACVLFPDMADEGSDHWVENLFPPVFGIDDASTDYHLQKEAPPTNVYEQLARNQISPQDVPHIRNVYERVWLMTKIKEKEEARQAEEREQEQIKKGKSYNLIVLRCEGKF